MQRFRKMPEKLSAPCAGRGRVQRAAKRAGLLAGARLISTADVLAIAYARRKLLYGLPLRRHTRRRPIGFLKCTARAKSCNVCRSPVLIEAVCSAPLGGCSC